MKVELDKKALISLVMGTSPNYNLFDNPIVDQNGRFDGSRGIWHWDDNTLEKLTESELYDLYIMCRESYE